MGREHRALALEEPDRHVRAEAGLGVRDREAGFRARPESSRSADQGMPVNVVSNRLQRVTQWMSWVTSTRGSSFSSRHVERHGRVDLAGDSEVPAGQVGRVLATAPACRTGHFSVRYCPAGSRAGSYPASRIFFSALLRNMLLH